MFFGVEMAGTRESTLRPRTAEEVDPVAVHDAGDVCVRIIAFAEQLADILEVGDGFQIARGLFSAEATVEIAADAAVLCVSSQLTDVVDVIDGVCQAHRCWIRFAFDPAGTDHPRVESQANDGVTFQQLLDLLVRQL